MGKSYIILDNVRIHACHGVMGQERVVGGDFVVSLKIGYDFSRAMQSDDIADTLSYADVYDVVRREMAVPSNLLENVAGRIVESLLRRFPEIMSLWLRLMKVNPPMGADCDGAGVEITVKNQ